MSPVDLRGIIYSVAFQRDGRVLASAGRDQAIRLWRVSARPEEGSD